MSIRDKRRMIREMCKSIELDLLNSLGNIPEEWNGFELRWLFAELVNRHYGTVRPLAGDKGRSRYRSFKNEVLVRNL